MKSLIKFEAFDYLRQKKWKEKFITLFKNLRKRKWKKIIKIYVKAKATLNNVEHSILTFFNKSFQDNFE